MIRLQRSALVAPLVLLCCVACSSSSDTRKEQTVDDNGNNGGAASVDTGSTDGGQANDPGGIAGAGGSSAAAADIKICSAGAEPSKTIGDFEGSAEPWEAFGDLASLTVEVVDDGANGTSSSLRIQGAEFQVVTPIGGDRAEDLSEFAGVSFWAKTNDPDSTELLVHFPDADSWPDAGTCSQTDNDTLCWNYHHSTVTLTTSWKQYKIDFAELDQRPGFGKRKPFVDTTKIWRIFFDIKEAEMDFQVDEFALTDCQ